MKQFNAKILSNEQVTPDHYVLSFAAKKAAKTTTPGQFFSVRVKNSLNPLLRRPFGAHKINAGIIEILYKVVGKATKILSTRKKGETLDVLGPLGNGFDLKPSTISQKPLAILVAGGHGVAPLYALAEKLQNPKAVIIGAKTKNHLVGAKEFRKLGVSVSVATEDDTEGHKGLVTDLLEKHIRTTIDHRQSTVYACGPKPMLKAIAELAGKYDIPCRVSFEEYMACGIGTCLGCPVKTHNGYKLVCKDGPVFDAKEIIWQ